MLCQGVERHLCDGERHRKIVALLNKSTQVRLPLLPSREGRGIASGIACAASDHQMSRPWII